METAFDAREKAKSEEQKLLMGMPDHVGGLFSGCQPKKTEKGQSKNRPKIHLAGVKSDLYNPVLSSFRRYDIENVQGKLSDEHSRSTLPSELVTLTTFNSDKFEPPQTIYPGYYLLPLPYYDWYQEKAADELSFLKNKDMSESWKNFLNNIPLSKARIVHIPKNKDFHFYNYVVKYTDKD